MSSIYARWQSLSSTGIRKEGGCLAISTEDTKRRRKKERTRKTRSSSSSEVTSVKFLFVSPSERSERGRFWIECCPPHFFHPSYGPVGRSPKRSVKNSKVTKSFRVKCMLVAHPLLILLETLEAIVDHTSPRTRGSELKFGFGFPNKFLNSTRKRRRKKENRTVY